MRQTKCDLDEGNQTLRSGVRAQHEGKIGIFGYDTFLTSMFCSRRGILSHQEEMTIVSKAVGLARERETFIYDISTNNVSFCVLFLFFEISSLLLDPS